MGSEEDYPLFVAPYYWTIFAPMANGGESLFGSNGDLRYLSDTGLETEEFLLKLIDAGLCAVPETVDEEGNVKYDTWGYPGNMLQWRIVRHGRQIALTSSCSRLALCLIPGEAA